jgi:hypothetical protein
VPAPARRGRARPRGRTGAVAAGVLWQGATAAQGTPRRQRGGGAVGRARGGVG